MPPLIVAPRKGQSPMSPPRRALFFPRLAGDQRFFYILIAKRELMLQLGARFDLQLSA